MLHEFWCLSFPSLGKFSGIICSHQSFAPLYLHLLWFGCYSFWISHWVLSKYCYLLPLFPPPLFSCSLFSIILSLNRWFTVLLHLSGCRGIYFRLHLDYSIFNFILTRLYFFISTERDSMLFSFSASILIIVVLTSSLDILLISVLINPLAVIFSCCFLGWIPSFCHFGGRKK